MPGAGEEGRHEIIIVRRGGDDEDEGHHGGAWKIAFADFMTAMMCFFLVMWLINAANEQTRASVASYFNPVKLIDRTTSSKGIDDIGDGPPVESSGNRASELAPDVESTRDQSVSGPSRNMEATAMAEVSEHSDRNLFDDPYAVLAEIAQATGAMQNVSSKGDGGAQDAGPATGASGGESYRDPFAPDFWSSQVEQPSSLGDTTEVAHTEGPVEREGVPEKTGTPPKRAAIGDVAELNDEDPFAMKPPAATQEAAAADEPAAEPAKAESNEKLAQEVRRELAAAFKNEKNLRGITVVPTDTGVTISIADDISQGMFEIGSAVPRRDLVLAMEKIGRLLSEHDGAVRIGGHTDGRPFAGNGYDNWRLSTARAHAAYYMLVRGGLDEKRISSVTGFADRKLKLPGDPLASVNRRIEILLETAG